MAVEILSVSLSDDSIEKLAAAITAQLTRLSNLPVTQSNPPSSETHRTRNDGVSETRADPWVGGAPADNQQWPQGGPQASGNIPHQGGQPYTTPLAPSPQSPQYAPGQQGQQPYEPPPQQQPQAPQGPSCVHGEMRFVPAGFSQATKKAYNAFYGCPQPRGAQDKCKSVSV